MRLSNQQAEERLREIGYDLFEMRQSKKGVSMLVNYGARKKDVAFTAPTLQALHAKVMAVVSQYKKDKNLLPEEIGNKNSGT